MDDEDDTKLRNADRKAVAAKGKRAARSKRYTGNFRFRRLNDSSKLETEAGHLDSRSSGFSQGGRGGGVGMCRCKGYCFQAVLSSIGFFPQQMQPEQHLRFV